MNQNPKVGRNDPCHCGSGKKYKKCHGAGRPAEGAEEVGVTANKPKLPGKGRGSAAIKMDLEHE